MPELTKIQTGFLEPQGPFKLDPGTESAPGIYLEGDENTGLYRSAENEIGVSIDGTQKFKFTSEGLKFNGTSLDGTPFMGAFDKDITDTAVDVFVYDTSRDSDGGAWRKRTQHTSWYNETLNTSIRGSRREFPAVAVIVATTNTITIYDGDDPDLPMWMVFTDGYNTYLGMGVGGITAVSMLNGIMSHCGTYDLHVTNFISDKTNRYGTDGITVNHLQPISGRNDNTSGNYNGPTTPNIVNRQGYDVAMTVLPNAPIDDATGLQVPTIAVATNGGVSVIKDDGTVVDGFTSITSIVGLVRFDGNKVIYAADNDSEYKWIYQFDIPSTDNTGNSYLIDPNSIITNYNHNVDFSTYSAVPLHYTGSGDQLNYTNDIAISNSNEIFVGAGRQLAKVQFTNGNYNPRTSLFSSITSTYNTGWQTWNIKGAFLSDTDATNVTGTELVTNGTFGSDVSGWTYAGTGSATYSSGTIQVTGDFGNIVYQDISLVIGETYVLSGDIVSGTNGQISIYENAYASSGSFIIGSGNIPPQTVNLVFTATTTTANLRLVRVSSTVTYDNISIRKAELDRSVNNKGLQVFGTVNKSPVAGSGDTASELVAYSGWSSSNYLRQPYNSGLNAGTGDFHIMCWVKGNELMLWHRGGDGNLTDLRCEFPVSGESANKPRFYMYDATGPSVISFFATQAFDTTTWHHCVWVKDSPTTGKLYIDGVLDSSGTASNGPVDITSTSANLTIGNRADSSGEPFNGSVALFRTGASAPSAEQVKKIYEDEKVLFQENADCTLYGSSDAVTALAYDEKTNLLHVGTSSGRSDFNGLRRINNTTEAVTTAISAYDGSIAQQ